MTNEMQQENTKGGAAMAPKGIVSRQEDYSRWYSDVIEAAGLAEHAPVRGCMIIKPDGYAVWELIQQTMDRMFKELGVANAYFPLFIPESFLKREAEHVEGFAPELAVVTHGGGKKLEEPLVVRPTSETIIYDAFSRWINSYRDLPYLINQWSNVVRWEMRPRLFLRTTEFLWQEGHTAHATAEEAESYALMILHDVYKKFAEEYLAMPVYTGKKSEKERFAGAKQTFCIEALMQDGKSLQAGTSHDLSDNFARPFNVSFLDDKGERRFVFQTSWGSSTRLIGGIIMSHSDDTGLVLPPRIAPIQAIIVPIAKAQDEPAMAEALKIREALAPQIRTKVDQRVNLRPGEKYYDWERKGVPLRIEIGPKDLALGQCVLARRDTGEKQVCKLEEVASATKDLLETIQADLFTKALERRERSNIIVDDWQAFEAAVEQGGYIFAHWCEETACEVAIKEKTKASTRCHPFHLEAEAGAHACVHCGKPSPSNKRWIFAKAY
jgi:prolyl-tRNA synthetase